MSMQYPRGLPKELRTPWWSSPVLLLAISAMAALAVLAAAAYLVP